MLAAAVQARYRKGMVTLWKNLKPKDLKHCSLLLKNAFWTESEAPFIRQRMKPILLPSLTARAHVCMMSMEMNILITSTGWVP